MASILKLRLTTVLAASAWILTASGLCPVQAQDGPVHGTVESVSGHTVTVELKEGYRVEAGTRGTVYDTKMTLGEETIVETGRLRVETADGRTVRASVSEGEELSTGQDVQFASVQSVGTLAVNVQPREAEVSVEGSVVGTGSVEETVAAGTREVGVTAEGCPPASESVDVRRGETSRVQLQLDCPMGRLVVRSNAEDAVVFLNGERLGTATLKETLDMGLYRLRVAAEGYEAKERSIQVEPGETEDLTFDLGQQVGRLTVRTSPASAQLDIDTTEYASYDDIGRTPVRDYELTAGTYDLRVRKEGYQTITDEVSVEGGSLTEKSYQLDSYQLNEEMGTLIVDSDPAGARVEIDGEDVGETRIKRKVEPGRYKIEVDKYDYESKTKYRNLEAGSVERVTFDLNSVTVSYSDSDRDSEDHSGSQNTEDENDGLGTWEKWGIAQGAGAIGAIIGAATSDSPAAGAFGGYMAGGTVGLVITVAI